MVESQRRTLFLLVVAVAIAVVAALFWALSQRDREGAAADRLLLPELAARNGGIGEIEIAQAGTRFRLAREGDAWVMPEKGGYPVAGERVSALLESLESASVVPEPAAAAAPEPPANTPAAEASPPPEPIRLVLRDASGAVLGDFTILKETSSPGGEDLVKHRLRLASGGEVLVEGLAAVDPDPLAWLDRTVIDIAHERIVEVRTGSPSDRLVIRRTEGEGSRFAIVEPEGLGNADIEGPWVLSDLAAGLERIEFEDVRPAQETGDDGDWRRVSFRTADGLEVQVAVDPSGEATWLRLDAGYVEPAVPAAAAPSEEGEDGEPADDPPPPQDVRREAEEIARRAAGWEYRIADYAAERLTAGAADVLQ